MGGGRAPCGRLLVAVVLALAVPCAADAEDAPALSPTLKKTFEAVRTAYFGGDSHDVWQVLVPAAARVKDSQIRALNEALEAEEIPPVEELLVDARLKLAQQGLASALPAPEIRERLLTLVGLERRIAAILGAHAAHPLLAAEPAATRDLEELERQLWDLHVLKNELLVAFRCGRYSQKLARGVPDDTFERLSATDQATVALSRVPDLAGIEQARHDVREAELARRLHRLETGVAILRDPAFRRERFLAAYSTQLDARVLTAFFEQRQSQAEPPPPLACAALGAPDAPDRVAALAAEAARLAGELAERSRSFFDGLHWWLRGRYGAGPDVGGLAKSAAALNQPGALVWLSMPTEPPEPTDPADPRTPSIPAVERRHHYTWAWEDRRVQERASYSLKTNTRTTQTNQPTFF